MEAESKLAFPGLTMQEALKFLLDGGHLIPIEVFGADDGYGLCDKFTKHSPGGSDCNRARPFMLRPSDELMTPEILEKCKEV